MWLADLHNEGRLNETKGRGFNESIKAKTKQNKTNVTTESLKKNQTTPKVVCVVALTSIERGTQFFPLVSYFLV